MWSLEFYPQLEDKKILSTIILKMVKKQEKH